MFDRQKFNELNAKNDRGQEASDLQEEEIKNLQQNKIEVRSNCLG